MSEKTEQPTPRRLKKAREEGQHPRSRLLGAALPALAVSMVGLAIPHDFLPWVRSAFSAGGDPRVLVGQGIAIWATVTGPVFGAACLGAVCAGLLQSGVHFDLGTVAPKSERLDWLGGLKRVASLKALPEAARPAVAVVTLLVIAGAAVSDGLHRCRPTPHLEPMLAFTHGLFALQSLAKSSLWALAALAGADLFFARWLHLRGLRMSRDEVKQEHKSQEGDPHYKSKRKAIHRQLALAGPARSVAQATVVVVNPTHIAVALRYAPDECAAPYVVARGREDEAFEIRKAARAMRVPIVRDVPLARSLIHCQPGDEIPEELFRAAAAVLKTVLPPDHLPLPKGATP